MLRGEYARLFLELEGDISCEPEYYNEIRDEIRKEKNSQLLLKIKLWFWVSVSVFAALSAIVWAFIAAYDKTAITVVIAVFHAVAARIFMGEIRRLFDENASI